MNYGTNDYTYLQAFVNIHWNLHLISKFNGCWLSSYFDSFTSNTNNIGNYAHIFGFPFVIFARIRTSLHFICPVIFSRIWLAKKQLLFTHKINNVYVAVLYIDGVRLFQKFQLLFHEMHNNMTHHTHDASYSFNRGQLFNEFNEIQMI